MYRLSLIVILAIHLGRTISADYDGQCINNIKVKRDETYNIANDNYPSNYTGGDQCVWIAVCPLFFNCRLDCANVSIPPSDSCYADQLSVSKTGSLKFSAADRHCGDTNFTTTSRGRRITVGFYSVSRSPGGRFNCTLTARPKNARSDK